MEDPIQIQPNSRPKTFEPGDFSFITREMERTMLQDAYDGISRVEGGWAYLSRPDVPSKEKGFMFSRDALIDKISGEIDKDGNIGHSGSSYGWTMRQMECIAKLGWDTYVEKILYPHGRPQKEANQNAFPYPCACRAAQGLTGWCGVAGGGVPACDH